MKLYLVAMSLFTVSLLTTGCDIYGLLGINKTGNVSSSRSDLPADTVPKEAFDAQQVDACGDGGFTSAGETAILRHPYLQRVTDHSADILWTSDAPEAMTVHITLPNGESVADVPAVVDEQADRPSFDQYVAAAADLEPDTLYCYSIEGESDTWLLPTGFRTAPLTGDDSEVRIAVMGDLGAQTSDQFMVRDQLMDVGFDFVLVAGDLAYDNGTLGDHEHNFFHVYEELLRQVPFFVISGNHDYANAGAIFREVFDLFPNGGPDGKERWYSFDWGPVHVVAIDTEQLNETQAAWVDQDLAATQQPWKLVLMHKPAFSSGKHGPTKKVQELFVPLFEKYGVQLVIAGHDHDYERTDPINGVTYVVTGSSGRGTRPVGSSSFTAYSEAVAHFGHITIDGDTLTFHAIDATGTDFDEVTIKQSGN